MSLIRIDRRPLRLHCVHHTAEYEALHRLDETNKYAIVKGDEKLCICDGKIKRAFLPAQIPFIHARSWDILFELLRIAGARRQGVAGLQQRCGGPRRDAAPSVAG
jgi:hypothetical protein